MIYGPVGGVATEESGGRVQSTEHRRCGALAPFEVRGAFFEEGLDAFGAVVGGLEDD